MKQEAPKKEVAVQDESMEDFTEVEISEKSLDLQNQDNSQKVTYMNEDKLE